MWSRRLGGSCAVARLFAGGTSPSPSTSHFRGFASEYPGQIVLALWHFFA